MTLENTIVNRILAYLNEEVEDCVAEKVHGNQYQVGRPDINGCWKGRCFRIEVKSPDHGNKPTKIQLLNLKQWRRAGAISFVAYSLEEVKQVIHNSGSPWQFQEVCKHGEYLEGCKICSRRLI